MLILGIDPGYAIVGFGLVESTMGQYRLVACGAINTPAGFGFPPGFGELLPIWKRSSANFTQK